MSVKVEGLSKLYGAQKALDNISFEAKKGDILGFLGPNGAGKTTTMKILTCFIPPSAGNALVCERDVEEDPMEVRRKIGYLPEHNPLYKDMYVREYLAFVARLHRIAKPQNRIAEMIELTGLGPEQHKLIGALSKGYRQRVGLAQAMLHNPEVLILDEPTSGLDPNQLVEIRQVIRDLGREKTVIFSSHIMQEVQALCNRVIIVNKGRIVADDPIDRLSGRIRQETILTVVFSQPVTAAQLKGIAGISGAENLGERKWKLTAPAGTELSSAVFRFAVEHQLTLQEMHQEEVTVEDVFQQLTR